MKTHRAKWFFFLTMLAVLITAFSPAPVQAETLAVCTRILYRELRRDCGKNSAGILEDDCVIKIKKFGNYGLSFGFSDLKGAVANVWHTNCTTGLCSANPTNDTLLGSILIAEQDKPTCQQITWTPPTSGAKPNIYLTFPWKVSAVSSHVSVASSLVAAGGSVSYDTFDFLAEGATERRRPVVVRNCGGNGQKAFNGAAGCDYAAKGGYKVNESTFLWLTPDGYLVKTSKRGLPKDSKAYPIVTPTLTNRRTIFANQLESAARFLRRFGDHASWNNLTNLLSPGLFPFLHDDTGLTENLLLLIPGEPRNRSLANGTASSPPQRSPLNANYLTPSINTLTRTAPIYGLALEWLRAALTHVPQASGTNRPSAYRNDPVTLIQEPQHPMLLFCNNDIVDGLIGERPDFREFIKFASCRAAHGWAAFMAAASWWDPGKSDANPVVYDGKNSYELRTGSFDPGINAALDPCLQVGDGCEDFVGTSQTRLAEGLNILQTARAFWDVADLPSGSAEADGPIPFPAAEGVTTKCKGETFASTDVQYDLFPMLGAWRSVGEIWRATDEKLWEKLDEAILKYQSPASLDCQTDDDYYEEPCEGGCRALQCTLNNLNARSYVAIKIIDRLRNFPSLHDYFQGMLKHTGEAQLLAAETNLGGGTGNDDVVKLANVLFAGRCTYDANIWFPSYFIRPLPLSGTLYDLSALRRDVYRAQLAFHYVDPAPANPADEEIIPGCPVPDPGVCPAATDCPVFPDNYVSEMSYNSSQPLLPGCD